MPDLIACCTAPVDLSDPDVFVGYYLPPFYTADGCDGSIDLGQAGRFETLAGVSQGTTLPAGWFPCGSRPGVSTGGGGGGGESIAQVGVVWQQGTFEDAGSGPTAWPDGGALSALTAERWTVAPIAAPYTQWAFYGLVVVVHEVDTATDGGDIVVTLQDTSGNNYATVTILDGTPADSPAGAQGIRVVAAGAAVATATTQLQFLVEDAPLGNDYWVEAIGLGVLELRNLAAAPYGRPTRYGGTRTAPRRTWMPSAIEATGRTISAWFDGTTWVIGVDVAGPSEWDRASHTFRNLAAGWAWNGRTLHTAFKKSPWVGRVAGSRMMGLCGSNGSGGIMERLDADTASDLLSTTYFGQADEGGGSDPRTAGSRLGCFVGAATFIASTRVAAPVRGVVRQDSVGGSLTAWAFGTSRNYTALFPSPQGWDTVYASADGVVAAADGVYALTELAAGTSTVVRLDNVGTNAPTLADVRDVWAYSAGGIDYVYVVVGNNSDRGVWEATVEVDPGGGAFVAANDLTWRQVFTTDDVADRPQSISGHYNTTTGLARVVLGLYDARATATGTYVESTGVTSTYRRTHYRCLDVRAGTPSWEVISNAANVNVDAHDVDVGDHPHVMTLIGESSVERGRIGGSNHNVQSLTVAELPNGSFECVTVGKTTPWICDPFATVPVWRPFSLGLGALAGGYQAVLATEQGIGWMGLGDDDRGGFHVDHGSPARFVWCLANDNSGINGSNNATYSICASYLGLYDAAGGLLYGAQESTGYRVAFPFGGAEAATASFVGVGAQVSTTVGTPLTPAYPTGIQDGDYCVVRMSNRTTTGAFGNPGSGVWTLLNNRTQATNIETVWYGCFYETGQALALVDHDNLGTASAEVFAVRGIAPGSPFDIASVDDALAAAATATPAEVNTTTPDALVVVSTASADQNALSVGGTGGFTGAASGASYDATGLSSAVAYKLQATPGAAGTVTFTETINGNDPWTWTTFVFRSGGSEAGQNTVLVKDYATIFAGAEFNCIGFWDAPDSTAQLRYLGVDAGRGIIRSAAGGGSPDTIVEAFTTNSNRSIFLRNGSGTYWVHVPGLGIYRSTDYGASWDLWWDKSIADPQDRWSGHMTHNPAIPNTLYVTFDSGGGVWTVPNAHTAAAGSGTAGSVPAGATRITGGSLPAGTERMGAIKVDPANGDIWVIRQPAAAQTRASVHRLRRSSGTTWTQEEAREVEEGGHLAQHLDAYAGMVILPTSGQGLLRRVP